MSKNQIVDYGPWTLTTDHGLCTVDHRLCTMDQITRRIRLFRTNLRTIESSSTFYFFA